MSVVALGALAVGLERGAGGGVGEGARCLAGVSTVGGSWNPRAASSMHAYQRFWTAKAPLLGCRGRPTVHVLNAGSISNNCVGATMNGLQGFAKCGPTSKTVDVVVQLARSAGLKSSDEACCPATPRSPIYPAYVYKWFCGNERVTICVDSVPTAPQRLVALTDDSTRYTDGDILYMSISCFLLTNEDYILLREIV